MIRLSDHAVCLCVDSRYHTAWPRIVEQFVERVGELSVQVNGLGDLLPLNAYRFIHDHPVPDTWRAATNAYWCYWGILEVVRTARDSGWPDVLLIEDDCEILPGFDDAVASARSQRNGTPWDVLYYGASHCDATVTEVGPNLLRVRGSYCTHCVKFNHTVYDAILSLPPTEAIDWQLGHVIAPAFNVLAVWPNLVVQRAGWSTILEREADYGWAWPLKGRPA